MGQYSGFLGLLNEIRYILRALNTKPVVYSTCSIHTGLVFSGHLSWPLWWKQHGPSLPSTTFLNQQPNIRSHIKYWEENNHFHVFTTSQISSMLSSIIITGVLWNGILLYLSCKWETDVGWCWGRWRNFSNIIQLTRDRAEFEPGLMGSRALVWTLRKEQRTFFPFKNHPLEFYFYQ